MTGELAARFTSGSQRARVVTESWGESNLYCPNCSSPKLTWLEPGHPASDYSCPKCKFWYQLKSQKSRLGDSITDGAYAAMMNAIHHDEMPSFYFMHYEIRSSRREEAQTSSQEFQMEPPDFGCYGSGGEGAIWVVRNLLLVPSFAFPPSAIIKRKPLSATARRAGWVGCNFALNRVPADARIPVVTESAILPASEVRARYKRVKPLKDIGTKERGWTLDVLNAIRRLVDSRRRGDESLNKKSRPENLSLLTSAPTGDFTTADAYAFTRELEQLHPDNRHVKDKIRQQLQVLRDAGLLLHLGRGLWRLP